MLNNFKTKTRRTDLNAIVYFTVLKNTGSPSGEQTQDGVTRESRIHDKQKAKMAALAQRAEKLRAAQEASNEAVLERVKHSSAFTINPCEPSVSAGRRRRSEEEEVYLREWKVSPVINEPHLDAEDNRHRRPDSWDEGEDSFWKVTWLHVHVSSKAAWK